ncbi:MAG TPA: wax ester/triacylglycerol synthase domain-containing protein [Candidatus Nanopelagicales bacterium]|nr:wax ester/triacylglycerol synthase domain-containing protein [Candidatus Nanopelagicales bacterium]
MDDPSKVGAQLRGWDAATFRTASGDPRMRSTVVALAVLDSAPNWDRLRTRMERLTHFVPTLRMRPLYGLFGLSAPRLALDPDFDIDVHVHRYRLPEGSGWNELLSDVRRMSLTDFDRNRALWEAVLIEGLPNGEAAFALKLHHSIADGQATVMMALSLFELGPDPNPDDPPTPDVPRGEDVGMLDIARANIEDNVTRVRQSAESAIRAGGNVAMQALGDPTGALDVVRQTVDSVSKAVSMPEAPLSPLWTDRGTTYHFGAFDFPFDRLRHAAKSRGFSVNDAFMAAVASGVDRYHQRYGVSVPELRVNVPISLRGDAGDRSGQASNAVAIARFEMPLEGLDVEDRMAVIHELVDTWRGAPAMRMADPLADVSWFVPVPVLAHAAKASDLTTSNVPGPPVPLYLAGARMVAAFPLVATIGAAVNVTMVTYDGSACIGVSSDDRSVPDHDELLEDLRWGFELITGDTVGPADRYGAVR